MTEDADFDALIANARAVLDAGRRVRPGAVETRQQEAYVTAFVGRTLGT